MSRSLRITFEVRTPSLPAGLGSSRVRTRWGGAARQECLHPSSAPPNLLDLGLVWARDKGSYRGSLASSVRVADWRVLTIPMAVGRCRQEGRNTVLSTHNPRRMRCDDPLDRLHRVEAPGPHAGCPGALWISRGAEREEARQACRSLPHSRRTIRSPHRFTCCHRVVDPTLPKGVGPMTSPGPP